MTSHSKDESATRLNKYLAHCGVASRRKTVDIIKAGKVTVNGVVEKLPYALVQEGDQVMYNGKPVKPQVEYVYVLLNKPKDVISTSSDDRGRKSVMDLVKNAKRNNLHTVGRLDRMTTGLILLTNDGDLTQKLTHPSSEVKKIYQVELNRNMTGKDLKSLQEGFELEDGFIRNDRVVVNGSQLQSV